MRIAELLPLLASALFASFAYPSPQDPTPARAPVSVDSVATEILGAELALALESVHALEWRLFELGFFDPDGAVRVESVLRFGNSEDELARYLLDGSPGVFSGALQVAYGGRSVEMWELLEYARYEAGLLAAERLLVGGGLIERERLLGLAGEPFLDAAPTHASDAARVFHGRSAEQSRLGPLGNGSAAYVVWGLLAAGEAWPPDEPELRWGFIQSLLECGVASDRASWFVQRALMPPLIPNDNKVARTGAVGLMDACEPLGFTSAHQEWLEDLRESVLSGAEPGAGVGASAPRLREWMAVMLHRVTRELSTRDDANARLRRGVLEERQLYWRELAEQASLLEFQVEMVAELRAMADGLDDFPVPERLAELRALEAAGGLDSGQEQELQTLQFQVDQAKSELVGSLAGLLVQVGAKENFALVADTLEQDVHHYSGQFLPDALRQSALTPQWFWLAEADEPGMMWLVRGHLDGEREVPSYGMSSLIAKLNTDAPPGGSELLGELLEAGTPRERYMVFARPNWMSPDSYREAYENLRDAEQGHELPFDERSLNRGNFIDSLVARQDELGAELLRKSFADGMWVESEDLLSLSRYVQYHHSKAALFALLTDEDRAQIIAAGQAPAGLFD